MASHNCKFVACIKTETTLMTVQLVFYTGCLVGEFPPASGNFPINSWRPSLFLVVFQLLTLHNKRRHGSASFLPWIVCGRNQEIRANSSIYMSQYNNSQVDSAVYPPWDGKMSTSQMAVMLCSWEGNRRPGRKAWQPTAGWVTLTWLSCLPSASVSSVYLVLYV